jgi:Lon protease-like protein
VDRDCLRLFPLPAVLFPSTELPLHIFEPRYRKLLADCLMTDRRFGLVHVASETTELEADAIGCIAEIVKTEELPDGRANIVVEGHDRFVLVELVGSEAPYAVGRILEFADIPEFGNELDAIASRVRDLFEVVARAARTLADETDPVPELPDDPSHLSFAIASVIELEGPVRQELLASRSPTARLRRLEQLLSPAVSSLAERADVHKRAKQNGKGTHTQP